MTLKMLGMAATLLLPLLVVGAMLISGQWQQRQLALLELQGVAVVERITAVAQALHQHRSYTSIARCRAMPLPPRSATRRASSWRRP